jgi:hypothetical protein
VYLAEWVPVWTSDGGTLRECQDHFARCYAGRVRDGDVRIASGNRFGVAWSVLELHLQILQAEFKDAADAWRLAEELWPAGNGSQVVQRGSLQEQVLLDYGKKMLPVTG